ncbi:MAG: hypothetical protein LBB04_02090 [Oscillospiraceae bacterium]|nr:hypothetical protein [Oscillospiraceae bacterium]
MASALGTEWQGAVNKANGVAESAKLVATLKLTANQLLDEPIKIKKGMGIVVRLNGCTITRNRKQKNFTGELFQVEAGGKLTILGPGYLDGGAKNFFGATTKPPIEPFLANSLIHVNQAGMLHLIAVCLQNNVARCPGGTIGNEGNAVCDGCLFYNLGAKSLGGAVVNTGTLVFRYIPAENLESMLKDGDPTDSSFNSNHELNGQQSTFSRCQAADDTDEIDPTRSPEVKSGCGGAVANWGTGRTFFLASNTGSGAIRVHQFHFCYAGAGGAIYNHPGCQLQADHLWFGHRSNTADSCQASAVAPTQVSDQAVSTPNGGNYIWNGGDCSLCTIVFASFGCNGLAADIVIQDDNPITLRSKLNIPAPQNTSEGKQRPLTFACVEAKTTVAGPPVAIFKIGTGGKLTNTTAADVLFRGTHLTLMESGQAGTSTKEPPKLLTKQPLGAALEDAWQEAINKAEGVAENAKLVASFKFTQSQLQLLDEPIKITKGMDITVKLNGALIKRNLKGKNFTGELFQVGEGAKLTILGPGILDGGAEDFFNADTKPPIEPYLAQPLIRVNQAGALHLIAVWLQNNVARCPGGAIQNHGEVRCDGCSFNKLCATGSGGAIANYNFLESRSVTRSYVESLLRENDTGSYYWNPDAPLNGENNTFAWCQAAQDQNELDPRHRPQVLTGQGGAIANHGGSVILNHSTKSYQFRNCYAAAGAVLYNDLNPNSKMIFQNVIFGDVGNEQSCRARAEEQAQAGGNFLWNGGSCDFRNVRFANFKDNGPAADIVVADNNPITLRSAFRIPAPQKTIEGKLRPLTFACIDAKTKVEGPPVTIFKIEAVGKLANTAAADVLFRGKRLELTENGQAKIPSLTVLSSEQPLGVALEDAWQKAINKANGVAESAKLVAIFKLVGNQILGDMITIKAGMDITVKLNGNTITRELGEKKLTRALFYVEDGGQLTILGQGTLDGGAGDFFDAKGKPSVEPYLTGPLICVGRGGTMRLFAVDLRNNANLRPGGALENFGNTICTSCVFEKLAAVNFGGAVVNVGTIRFTTMSVAALEQLLKTNDPDYFWNPERNTRYCVFRRCQAAGDTKELLPDPKAPALTGGGGAVTNGVSEKAKEEEPNVFFERGGAGGTIFVHCYAAAGAALFNNFGCHMSIDAVHFGNAGEPSGLAQAADKAADPENSYQRGGNFLWNGGSCSLFGVNFRDFAANGSTADIIIADNNPITLHLPLTIPDPQKTKDGKSHQLTFACVDAKTTIAEPPVTIFKTKATAELMNTSAADVRFRSGHLTLRGDGKAWPDGQGPTEEKEGGQQAKTKVAWPPITIVKTQATGKLTNTSAAGRG